MFPRSHLRKPPTPLDPVLTPLDLAQTIGFDLIGTFARPLDMALGNLYCVVGIIELKRLELAVGA